MTDYPWHTGAQGRNVISNWDTTLQQPKGLHTVYLEGTTNSPNHQYFWQYFWCGDYAPK
ncbi:hypothetical protein ACWCQS_15780 [Streptomyces sp. NPDC002076]